MKKLKSGTSFTSILAIMTFSFISQTQSMINSVIQDIIETFPQVPVPTIRMISTVPAITALIVSIIVGAMVGKKLSLKRFVSWALRLLALEDCFLYLCIHLYR